MSEYFPPSKGNVECLLELWPNKNNFEGETGGMYVYDTVTEAVKGLKERGFELDFNLQENCLVCNDRKFEPTDFEIVEVYRFEGNTDPADEAVVYAIQSVSGIKGILVSGYGISAGEMSSEMASKLQMHRM